MESRILNITVNIEGIDLPMNVKDAEEEKLYRDAAVLIQRKLRDLRRLYPGMPSEKYYYAMAMLYTGVDAVKADNLASTEPYVDMMKDLEQEMDAVLK